MEMLCMAPWVMAIYGSVCALLGVWLGAMIVGR